MIIHYCDFCGAQMEGLRRGPQVMKPSKPSEKIEIHITYGPSDHGIGSDMCQDCVKRIGESREMAALLKALENIPMHSKAVMGIAIWPMGEGPTAYKEEAKQS